MIMLSWTLMIGGIFLGLYVGIIKCFIGGIVDLINIIKSPYTITAWPVAWGIAKIIFATLFGIISGAVPFVIGALMRTAAILRGNK